MNRIVFATHNANKLREIRSVIDLPVHVLTLNDIQFHKEIPEPFDTYEENAIAKAGFVFEHTGLDCFAEDSGLEVECLGGRPGVFSARYSGIHGDADANIRKVLEEMINCENRRAKFCAVIAFVQKNQSAKIFRGEVNGSISREPTGHSGFGYDPIFIPDGYDMTFAQLDQNIKHQISHRAKAFEKFAAFLTTVF